MGRCDLPGGTWHACLWTPQGDVVDLGALDESYSDAWSINDQGEVVGKYYLNPNWEGARAFLWTRKHGMVDLNTLVEVPDGVILAYANSIDDFGWITGMNNLGTAYLLIP